MKLETRKIFNSLGDDSMESRQLIGGNPTGIANLNTVKYKWASTLYTIMVGDFWIPQKISLIDDRTSIKELTSDEMAAFKDTLSFLIALDSMQTSNLPKLADYITAPEVSAIFTIQAFQELIHSQSYQYLLQELFPSVEREEIYNRWRDNPILLKRNEFIAEQYDDFNREPNLKSFKRAIAADLALEGIYFFSGFNFFYQLASRNKVSNVAKMIAYIEKDEKCLVGDTEVLTTNGWTRIDKISTDDLVYQYDVKTGENSFVHPIRVTSLVADKLYKFSGPGFSQTVTGDHRMIVVDGSGVCGDIRAKDVVSDNTDFSYVLSGNKVGSIKHMTPEQIELVSRSKSGEIELFDWIGPILQDIDSAWAREFIEIWSRAE